MRALVWLNNPRYVKLEDLLQVYFVNKKIGKGKLRKEKGEIVYNFQIDLFQMMKLTWGKSKKLENRLNLKENCMQQFKIFS